MNAERSGLKQAEAEVYAHKLFAPTQYAGAIRRRALLERIFAAACRVVVLQGPAGHGKSTALQQLKSECEQQGVLTGWLSFDEADNDVRRFSLHMQALIARLMGATLEPATDSGEGGELGHRRSDWMIDRLLRLDRPVAIYFDEFQTLRDKSILAFFRHLFEHLPENVRIFVGSRSVPEVGLPRLVIGNRALILRADDLRFSPAEVEEFFAGSTNLEVSREEVAAIYSRTEGWPAALQLFRLALVSPQVRRSLGDLSSYRPRELAEYLVDNVLSLQPPSLQEFLLRTSLLNRLSAPLCDLLTGRSDSQDVLQQLERSGLFLRVVDPELRWYKYHALFSTCLAEQLRATAPQTVQEVHRRAAEWYLAQGLYEEAVHHYIACREFSRAADAMNVWATHLVAGAHLSTVERWYERLPFEEVARRPDLAIKVAWALVFLRRSQKLRPLQELLERTRGGEVAVTINPDVVLSMAAVCADDVAGSYEIAQRVPMPANAPEGFAAFELGAESNLIAYAHIARGEFDEAQKWLAQARAYSDRGDATFSGGYTRGLCGVNLLLRGELQAALEKMREGMAEQQMHLDGSFAAAALVSCYIWALYEANELDQVETLFAQYRDSVANAVLLDFLAVAYLPMARTHDARGRPGKALEVLEEAESIAQANGWQRLAHMVQLGAGAAFPHRRRDRACTQPGDAHPSGPTGRRLAPVLGGSRGRTSRAHSPGDPYGGPGQGRRLATGRARLPA